MDAHKAEYIDHLNIILDRGLLAPTGIILADDGTLPQDRFHAPDAETITALCRGLVADSSDRNFKATDEGYLIKAESMRAFNEHVIRVSRGFAMPCGHR
jgi:predicted O-methyltransferase YrrM